MKPITLSIGFLKSEGHPLESQPLGDCQPTCLEYPRLFDEHQFEDTSKSTWAPRLCGIYM